MIVVKVELHSAITGKVTEIARAVIHNVGGTNTHGDYKCFTLRGRDAEALEKNMRNCGHHVRDGAVSAYPRLALHVWNLVARSLASMRYK